MNKIKHTPIWRTKEQKTTTRGVIKVRVPYYKCKRAIGVANPDKIAIGKEKVTCKNCLRWYKDE